LVGVAKGKTYRELEHQCNIQKAKNYVKSVRRQGSGPDLGERYSPSMRTKYITPDPNTSISQPNRNRGMINRGTIDYRSKVKQTALISMSGDFRRIVKLCKGSMITQLLGAGSQDKYEKGRVRESRTTFEHDKDYIRYNPRVFDGTRQHTTWPHAMSLQVAECHWN
jgi:hypothetical protein